MKLLIPGCGPSLIVPRRYEGPMAPQPIVDATIEWARGRGRRLHWRWSPEMECWTVNLEMSPNAPAMRAYQEGQLKQAEPPTEGIPLMEQVLDADGTPTNRFRALDLEAYGPTGIVALLEQADTWSGRGEFRSITEMISKTAQRSRQNKAKVKERQCNWARDLVREVRRQVQKIPFHRVGIELSNEET